MMVLIIHAFIHVHTLVIVILLLLFSPLAHLLLHFFLLGHLTGEQVLLVLLLMLLILARLLLFHRLQAHPVFVATRASLIYHLLFDVFTAV